MNAFVSTSETATARKGKLKEDSSSQSGSSSIMSDIISNLNKLGISFTRAHMWKQYNKLREVNIADMEAAELASHREALRLIKKDLNFATQNAAEVRDKDIEYNIYVLYFKLVCIVILISMCHILN
jgi:hypothetical protein